LTPNMGSKNYNRQSIDTSAVYDTSAFDFDVIKNWMVLNRSCVIDYMHKAWQLFDAKYCVKKQYQTRYWKISTRATQCHVCSVRMLNITPAVNNGTSAYNLFNSRCISQCQYFFTNNNDWFTELVQNILIDFNISYMY